MDNVRTEAPEDVAELDRLVGWFIQNRKDIAREFFVDDVECVNGRVIGVTRTVDGRGRLKVKERKLAG